MPKSLPSVASRRWAGARKHHAPSPGRTDNGRSDSRAGSFCGAAGAWERPWRLASRRSEPADTEAEALRDVVVGLAERNGVVDVERPERGVPDQAGTGRS